jgi:hypothetical protein
MSIINNIMNKTQELISGNGDDTNSSDVGDVGESQSETTDTSSPDIQSTRDTAKNSKPNKLYDKFKNLDCNNSNFYTKECNAFLLEKELMEQDNLAKDENVRSFLYPNLNDKSFNIKIASKKEFNDTKYDGTIHEDIKGYAEKLSKMDFELQPHQQFVKNFLSSQTPYNSLLLFHGLGTGKTCSSIGVCEEMRDYMKQSGITKKIIIVASENVQDNFRSQLFDESRMKFVNGLWTINSCIGNKLINEVNPTNIKAVSKAKLAEQIRKLIKSYYLFLGYGQFANYIIRHMNVEGSEKYDSQTINKRIIKKLRNEFNDRLIVIDEIHNIRLSDDNANKKVAIYLERLVKSALNMKLVLLSATPMYNTYKEIIWLLNLMNMNDRRGKMYIKNVFDKNGNFKNDGEELLMRKARGYVSFVRGENPYTFPYRVYPNEFAPNNTFPHIKYPNYQMNLRKIPDDSVDRILYLYLNTIEKCDGCGECQYCLYRYVVNYMRNKENRIVTNKGDIINMPSFDNMTKFGYTTLQNPLRALIIAYPYDGMNDAITNIGAEKYSNKLSADSVSSGLKEADDDKVEELEVVEDTQVTLSRNKKSSKLTQPLELEEKSQENPETKLKIYKRCPKGYRKEPKTGECKDKDGNIIGIVIKPTALKKTPSLQQNKNSSIKKPEEEEQKEESDHEEDEQKEESEHEEEEQKEESDHEEEEQKEESDHDEEEQKETIETTDDESEFPSDTAKESEKGDTLEKDDTSEKVVDETGNQSEDGDEDESEYPTDTITKNGDSEISSSEGDKQKGGFDLNPNELTGKAGLERMMSFTDTQYKKDDFEYRPHIEEKYGRIFSYDKIGKYSVKIKTLLDCIYKTNSKDVSDGVILVYSQYLDAGLIPVALALEELGFVRYGKNIKTLFKTKPQKTVDARTLNPPSDSKSFMPARYSMITGDKRISPDNDYEVKGLTDPNNTNGEKVKFVLISKAGAEGIDFKYIRQVHILDPWYNTNRMEQIIGRGVRNNSHKALDFEKRNVQIFMHGTILGDNKEETADLYVYRFAELKAIQIGKITRLLKETAVDCILNHEQTNFTNEQMSKILKKPITQQLSDGKVLKKFKVGDMPFSPACDYMKNCDYLCRPNDVGEEVNQDTYNEKFIFMNNEKIKQKIRMLMKMNFFYTKDVLISMIRNEKKYPLVQIYASLTQMIDDEKEIITDKYSRSGRLVNVGDYYLFQPLELNDTNVSIFERSRPIDYKSDSIVFEINKKILKNPSVPFSQQLYEEIGLDEDKPKLLGSNDVIKKMSKKYELTQQYIVVTKNDDIDTERVSRGDNDWYKHAGIVIRKLSLEYPDAKDRMNYYLVSHIIEELFYSDKLKLMKYIYSLEDKFANGSFEWYVKEYFKKNTIKTDKHKFLILYDLEKMKMFILDNNKWSEATPEDQREIRLETDELTFQSDKYNKIVGFLGYKRKNVALVFKVKDITSKRDTGAVCEEAGKEKSMDKLNLILNEKKYTKENTKMVKDKKGKIIKDAVSHTEICVIQEIIMRYFDDTEKNNKRWFLTPDMALYYNLYKILN